MIETVQVNDGIDEPEFGYYARMEVYSNLSSDMKELAVMLRQDTSNDYERIF